MRRSYHVGFISSHYLKNRNNSNFETKEIIKNCKFYFRKLTIIDPRELSFIFNPNLKRVKIYYKSQDISAIDGLLIRSTKGYEKSIEILTKALKKNGCVFTDSPNRHNGKVASKMMSSIERVDNSSGALSIYAFSLTQTKRLLKGMVVTRDNSIICKPIYGRKGKGVKLCTSKKQILEYAIEHFNKSGDLMPLFMQKAIKIVEEYRIVLIDGKVISSVIKIVENNQTIRNAAQGAKFMLKSNRDLENFVMLNVSNSGVLGVDAAIDEKGKFYIIEANRAPLWKTFQDSTEIDVGKLVVEALYKKIKSYRTQR